jgi:endonuclease/exonuclease/phosphatase family metal-dependent hydrolase
MRSARALAALAALAAAACGSPVRNYTDPEGPVYRTSFAAGRPRATPDTLRVVTFNIEHAQRIERAIEVLSQTPSLRDPDLLLLQEMDVGGTERIARALRLDSAYVPASVHTRFGRDFGNAVLSRWPIGDVRKLLLPHESRGLHQRRIATVATVAIAGLRVRVYSVHLETTFRLGQKARVAQARAVLEDAAASPDPVVVAGDLNSRELGGEFEARGYAWLTRDVEDTIGWFAFDHVFARGLAPAGPASASAGAEDERGASDHRPVWALLRFAGGREPRAEVD